MVHFCVKKKGKKVGVAPSVAPSAPRGTLGAPGQAGATGPAGPSGTNGTNGANGAAGANGTDGSNGADGATGATGPDGADGATGPTGAGGPAGAGGGGNVSIIGGGGGSGSGASEGALVRDGNDRYLGLYMNISDEVESILQQAMPVAGSVSGLRIRPSKDPGDPGDQFTFTLRKNGGDEIAQQCTIIEPATSCVDPTGSVSYVAGDLLSIRTSDDNTTPETAKAYWTAVFSATP